jgi:nucleoside-diphosphate-sugar epimerase
MAIKVADKRATVRNIDGEEFKAKYGFKCPVGVRGRNSDNKLYKEKMGWEPTQPLIEGMKKTYQWINKQLYK